MSFIEIWRKHSLTLIAFITIFTIVIPGMSALSELSSRDKELEYLENQKISNLVEIASNLQVHAEHAIKKDGLYLVSIDKTLLDKKKSIDKDYSCLSERMIKGISEKKSRSKSNEGLVMENKNNSKCPQDLDKWFAKTSTNEILIRLLFCSSIVGSIIILLWGAGTHPKIDEFVFAVSGGIGAGIICSLFFTSNTWAPGVLGSLPIVGSSTKVLFGFLAGMFSGKLLSFISDGLNIIINKYRTI